VSTDYWQETAPCLCGKGQFVINHWSTDWRAGEHLKVDCEDCGREYSVTLTAIPGSLFTAGPHHRLWFTRRSAIEAHAAACRTREQLRQADPDVIAVQEELCCKLQSLKFGTVRHRWLKERNFYRASLTSFRKEWKERGPEAVARSIVRFNNARFPYLEVARARFDAVAVPEVASFTRPFVRETAS
jgi:hypothetical protein